MSIRNQFLFLISDTDMEDKVLSELEKAMDGENVAIIYNSSKSAPSCRVIFPLFTYYTTKFIKYLNFFFAQDGLYCRAQEMTRAYFDAISKSYKSKMKVAFSIHSPF